MNRLRVFLTLVACIAIFGFGSTFLIAGLQGKLGWPEWWEIPPGERGWVALQYENPACPSIEQQGFFRIVSVSAGGMACTKDTREPKLRYHWFVSNGPNGSREYLSPVGGHSASTAEGVYDVWFLGTKEELTRKGNSWRPPKKETAQKE
jgi:hypothetical protein